MRILAHWLILTLAILAVPYVISGIHVSGILVAVVVAAVLGFINMVIRPIVNILALPLNILTLGLFSIIINGAFFWFVGKLIDGFTIDAFTDAVWGAIIVAILNWLGNKILGEHH